MGMAIAKDQGPAISARLTDYRRSFQRFSEAAALVQRLRADRGGNSAQLADAVVEMENGRVSYNEARDLFAAELLSAVPVSRLRIRIRPPQPAPKAFR